MNQPINRTHESHTRSSRHRGACSTERYHLDPLWVRCDVRRIDGDDSAAMIGEPGQLLLVTWHRRTRRQQCYFALLRRNGDLLVGQCAGKLTAKAVAKAHACMAISPGLVPAPSIDDPKAMIPPDVDALTRVFADAQIGLFAQPFFDDVARRLAEDIGRDLLADERNFLFVHPWRMQAVRIYPFLLPLLVLAGKAEPGEEVNRFLAVTTAIDKGEMLHPILQRMLGVPSATLKAMRTLPSRLPVSKEAESLSFLRPDRVAPFLAGIPPEKLPIDRQWLQFLDLIAWVESIWQYHGGGASDSVDTDRIVVEFLTAGAWLELLQRPRALPSLWDLDWIDDLLRSIRTTHPWRGRLLRGSISGQDVVLPVESWAVVHALRRHPADLGRSERNRWGRRAYQPVRAALLDAFGDRRLPVAVDRPVVIPGGYTLAPVPTVRALVSQSEVARNCLSDYLPGIMHRHTTIFAINRDDGTLVGHAELCLQEGRFVPGQRAALYNRPLPSDLDDAVENSLERLGETLGDHPRPVDDEDQLVAERARNLIHAVEARIHADAARQQLGLATLAFGLSECPSEASRIAEIENSLAGNAYHLACLRALDHASGLSTQPRQPSQSLSDQTTESDFPLPVGGDVPDGIVLFVHGHLPSRRDNMKATLALVRACLGSYSLCFSQAHSVCAQLPLLAQVQIDALADTFREESSDLGHWLHGEPLAIANLAAQMVLRCFVLLRWLGHKISPGQEAAWICHMLARPIRFGLTDWLLSIPMESWHEVPSMAFVFRHALPTSHPAWAIGDSPGFAGIATAECEAKRITGDQYGRLPSQYPRESGETPDPTVDDGP